MRKFIELIIIFFVSFVILGCSGKDGDDGKVYVTLEGTDTFKTSTFLLGCIEVPRSDGYNPCLYYLNGTRQSGSVDEEKLYFVAPGTRLEVTNPSSALGYGIYSTSPDIEGTVDLSKNEGESGSSDVGIIPKDGTDGSTIDYTATFSTTSISITK